MFFGSLFCTHVSMSISPCLSYMFFGTFILFEMLCAVWYHLYNLMNVTGFPLVHFLHYENRFVCYRKLTSRSCPVLFTLSYFFLYIHSHLLQQKNGSFDLYFSQQVRPLTTDPLCIFQDYFNVEIGFNMIHKCYALPIVYTMLALIRKVSIVTILLRVKRIV